MLIVVVGPSGVGKDSLMDGARGRLGPDYVFARREITRPLEAGGEHHLELDEPAFRAKAAAGGYALWWEAHGLLYGLDAAIDHDLAAGRRVVANVSRTVLDQARRRFDQVRVISITADPRQVAGRLARRGREDAADVAARLARGQALEVAGPDVTVIHNDGPLEAGIDAFVAALTR